MRALCQTLYQPDVYAQYFSSQKHGIPVTYSPEHSSDQVDMEDTWEGRHALLSYTALVATQAQPLVPLATHLYVDTLWSEDDNRLAALACQYTMCLVACRLLWL